MADEIPEGFEPVSQAPVSPPISAMPAGFEPVEAPRVFPPMEGVVADKLVESSGLGRILDAFDVGARQAWGTKPLGNWLTQYKAFDPENGPTGIGYAFNAGFNRPLAAILDGLIRTPAALYYGVGGMVIQGAKELEDVSDVAKAVRPAALARDLVAMPDAFMGSAGALSNPRAPIVPVRDRVVNLHEARELKVIGEERPPMSVGTPAEAAANAVRTDVALPAVSKADDVAKSAPVSQDASLWRQNFDGYVNSLETGDQVKALIKKAADEKGEFVAARQGDISLSHVSAVAEAAGVEASAIDRRGLGRMLRNDAEVEVALQTMLTLNEKVFEAGRTYAQSKSFDDFKVFQETVMRSHLAVEQVAGLRAEWGRTGNVFQKFQEAAQDAQTLGRWMKDNYGRSMEDMKALADAISRTNSREQAARLLSDFRKPGFMDRLQYYWANALLSGPFSQAGYAIADMFHAGFNSLVVTPTAAAIGKARQVVTGVESERVFFGEAAGRMYGYTAGVPDSLVAAWEALKADKPTMLPREVATGGKPFVNPITELKPDTSKAAIALTATVGAPTRVLGGLESFFRFQSYRAEIEAQAYRQAVRDGHTPGSSTFWNAQREYRNFPTEKMMDLAVEHAKKMTYTQELGETGKAFQELMRKTQVGRFVVPFFRIPANVFKATQEMTPLAYANADMRADLLGRNGAVKRDIAQAKIVAGSALMGWAASMALSDNITGEGPKEPDERAKWLLTHEPNSVKINGYWVNHQRFGQFSNILSLTADSVHGRNYLSDQEYAAFAEHMVMSTASTVMNSTGMRGVADLVKASTQTHQYGSRYVVNFATSFMPFSSGMGQIASIMDDNQREAKTLLDAAMNKIPVVREGLYPVRDWKGVPVANSRSEWGAFMATRKVNADPIDMEMLRLGIKPARPLDVIKGVKLTAAQYDEYQSTAGALTQRMLGALVSQPGWTDLPEFSREQTFRRTIESSRHLAQTAMQMRYPNLILKGVDDQINRIQGYAPQHKKRTDNPIDNIGGAQ